MVKKLALFYLKETIMESNVGQVRNLLFLAAGECFKIFCPT